MAEPNLTSGERLNVYRRLFLLNRSFHFIKELLGFTQEVQMEINTYLLNPLESSEDNDLVHFGKVRIAMEKRLKS